MKILLAEDHDHLREIIEDYLIVHGYVVERKVSTVRRGIVLGRITGSRNFTCILLKGFLSIISLYSR